MQDLISKSALMEGVRNTITEMSGTLDWLNLISRQPTAYDVDKVVEELEELENESNMLTTKCAANILAVGALGKAIEIVKAGGVE